MYSSKQLINDLEIRLATELEAESYILVVLHLLKVHFIVFLINYTSSMFFCAIPVYLSLMFATRMKGLFIN